LLDPLSSAREAGDGFLALGSLVRGSLGCVAADFHALGQALAR